MSPRRAAELARWAAPILLGILVIATFRDYGYSGDEHTQNRWYGQAVLRFMTSLGEDRSAVTTRDYALYGGTFDVAAELLVAVSPLAPRNARHLANVLAGLAGIAGCWAMARRLGGAGAGAPVSSKAPARSVDSSTATVLVVSERLARSLSRSARVAGFFPEGIAEELPENFRVFPASPWPDVRADYLVASTRWGMDQWWPEWKEVAAIDRVGMRFAVVKADPELAQRVPRAPPPTPDP